VDALGRLIGWKLALSGDPVKGTITEVSGGGPLNAYEAGTKVRLNRISGHRDGDATECPGNALYAQLPQIRTIAQAAANRVAARPTLTVASTVTTTTAGRGVPLTGRLGLPEGASAAGATVVVQRLRAHGWVDAVQATAGSDGSWSATVHPHVNARYRARWAGSSGEGAVTSPSYGVLVRPWLTLRAADVHVPVGGRAVLSGSSMPAKPTIVVRAYRRVRAGKYVQTAHWRVRTTKGAWTLRVRLHRVALYRFVARTAADKATAFGHAKRLYVRAVAGTPSDSGGAGPG
jgi:hypothetical protein